MPNSPLFLADLVVPAPQPKKTPVTGDIAVPTEEPAPALGPEVSPSPPLIILIAVFALAAIVAVVLISLKGRRGSSSDSKHDKEAG